MKPHRALATVEEFKAASQLPLGDRIAWWNELVRLSKI